MFKTEVELNIIEKAKLKGKTIVLPEAGYSKEIYEAGVWSAKNKVANIVFLVKSNDELNAFGTEHNDIDNLKIININNFEYIDKFANVLMEKRKSKGLTYDEALELLKNEIYFATVYVEVGMAHGMVCGAVNTTANSLRPALQIIKGKTSNSVVSSFFIMVSDNKEFGDNGVFVLADCALNENPTAEQLAIIACDTAGSAVDLLGIEPRVAMLSYSTHGSAGGEVPEKVQKAVSILKSQNLPYVVDGDLQLDASIVESVALKKAPNSEIKGKANVLIFPNLESGNISYKIMQRLAGFTAIGPICQGFNKPVNDVSRGAKSLEICLIIAITCLQ